MIKMDPRLIVLLGIDLPKNQQTAFTEHAQETLNERVGLALIDTLNDDQAAHLIQLSRLNNPKAFTAWVRDNVPNYQQIISDQVDILMEEIADSADHL